MRLGKFQVIMSVFVLSRGYKTLHHPVVLLTYYAVQQSLILLKVMLQIVQLLQEDWSSCSGI